MKFWPRAQGPKIPSATIATALSTNTPTFQQVQDYIDAKFDYDSRAVVRTLDSDDSVLSEGTDFANNHDAKVAECITATGKFQLSGLPTNNT